MIKSMHKKIGIIGCQSKHAEFFGSLFNVKNEINGYRVEYILADDEPDRLPYVLEKAQITHDCEDLEELIDQSDIVLITYRFGERHYKPAMACIEAGKPVFIDKPFTITEDEALDIVEASRKHNVVAQGGSTLCFDPQINLLADLSKRSSFGSIAYRANINSPFDGYRFYGSHLTDLCAAIFGDDAVSVRSYRYEENINHLVCYPSSTVVLQSTPDFKLPQVILNPEHLMKTYFLSDARCYYFGMKAFIDAIESKDIDSQNMNHLVFSTRLLAAIMESLSTGDEIQLAND